MKKARFYWLLINLLFTSVTLNAQPQVSPTPSWVTQNKYDYTKTNLDIDAEDGYVDLVYNKQVSLFENVTYRKRAMKILTEEGVQNNSEISVVYEPSYEKLFFHTVNIIRDGKVINKLKLSKIETMRQESERSRFIYNGTYSSVLILDDVRNGDIIEYSFSLKGFNPIFNNKYTDDYSLNYSVPLYYVFLKVLVPQGRELTFKNTNSDIKPVIKPIKSGTSYEWQVNDVPALRLEDGTPSWYNPYSSVMLSEFKTWKEVKDWGIALYPELKNFSSEFQAKINEFKKIPSQEKQILAALRFVQDDVRYMGIEIGENSHRPTNPEKIFSQRFGDCKDKSYLMYTIMQALGIESSPVFINTTYKKTVKDWLPAPTAFNHVTIRVKFNNHYYWFDPTASYQRGSIDEISYPDYQCGLVLNENTSSLTNIALQSPGKVKITESFTIPPQTFDNIKLVVTTDYSGSYADDERRNFKNTSLFEMKKTYKRFYSGYYEKIVCDSLSYLDNEETGVFRTMEYYTVPDLWTVQSDTKKAEFNPYVIDGLFKKPKDKNRTMPFAVSYPAHYVEDIVINVPDEWDPEESQANIKCPTFSMKTDFSYSNRKIALHYEYRSLNDHVSANDLSEFNEGISQKESESGYYLSYTIPSKVDMGSVESDNKSSGRIIRDVIIACGITIMIVIAIVKTPRSRRGRRY